MSKIKFEDLILFEDDNYILINKPPFISSLEDRSSPNNILNLARKYHEKAQLGHRLDKDTSGCLIIAKNEKTYRHISLQFQDRQVRKRYHALTEGTHDFKEKVVDVPIFYRSGGDARIDFKQGKPAVTLFSTLKVYRNYTLVESIPVSGRLHQIRVHLAFINAPIAGDQTYGGHPFYLSSIKSKYKSEKWEIERPLIKRFALHAAGLEFQGLDGEKINVEAPYPKDFKALMNQLNQWG